MGDGAASSPDFGNFDDPTDYRARVMIGVLNGVVTASTPCPEEGGVLDLVGALNGMCDAIAMLVAATQIDKTPKDRRDTADFCRKRVLLSLNEAARRVAAGEELPWTLDPVQLQ